MLAKISKFTLIQYFNSMVYTSGPADVGILDDLFCQY